MGSGESLHALHRDREALPKLTSALESMKALSAADPSDIPLIVAVGRIHRDIGDVLLATHDEKGALSSYMDAVKTAEEPIRRAPANMYYQRQHTDAVESLGRYYATLSGRQAGLTPEARKWLGKGLAVWQDWTRRNIAVPYAAVRERQVAALLAVIEAR
jgi:hypothetical protein